MATASLDTLPPDILFQILGYLPLDTDLRPLLHLRATCRQLHSTITSESPKYCNRLYTHPSLIYQVIELCKPPGIMLKSVTEIVFLARSGEDDEYMRPLPDYCGCPLAGRAWLHKLTSRSAQDPAVKLPDPFPRVMDLIKAEATPFLELYGPLIRVLGALNNVRRLTMTNKRRPVLLPLSEQSLLSFQRLDLEEDRRLLRAMDVNSEKRIDGKSRWSDLGVALGCLTHANAASIQELRFESSILVMADSVGYFFPDDLISPETYQALHQAPSDITLLDLPRDENGSQLGRAYDEIAKAATKVQDLRLRIGGRRSYPRRNAFDTRAFAVLMGSTKFSPQLKFLQHLELQAREDTK